MARDFEAATTAGLPAGDIPRSEAPKFGPPGPPPPAILAAIFGPSAAQALQYADFLADAGIQRGLLGPREGSRLWDRHILNCAVVAELVPAGAVVCDLGSGAGLPGIVVALARPDVRMILLEPLQRRVTFLSEAVSALQLSNVVVVRGRAQDVVDEVCVDVVVARAVAPLASLVEWSIPLMPAGGRLLALKGASVVAELAEVAPLLDRLGALRWDTVAVGGDLLVQPTTVVRIVLGASGKRKPPRRAKSKNRGEM